jgi:hypothetical protein
MAIIKPRERSEEDGDSANAVRREEVVPVVVSAVVFVEVEVVVSVVVYLVVSVAEERAVLSVVVAVESVMVKVVVCDVVKRIVAVVVPIGVVDATAVEVVQQDVRVLISPKEETSPQCAGYEYFMLL